MRILSIETSCDETAISILKTSGTSLKSANFEILANKLYSQIEIHKEFGGVYPMVAKREHGRNLVPLLMKALKEANYKIINNKSNIELPKKTKLALNKILEREPELLEMFLKELLTILSIRGREKIDAIAVTYGPGLEPALWVGVNFAKALSLIWGSPIIPVNHMLGHFYSVLMPVNKKKEFKIKEFKHPALALLVSGGHTELILSNKIMQFKKIGATRDDACGEAFDKVARMLGLPYPGGPEVSKLATSYRSNSNSESSNKIKFPRPMLNSPDYDFSFSGLKTSVLYTIRDLGKLTEDLKKEVAYEFENAVVEVLVKKTLHAVQKYKIKTLIVAGGVASNTHLKKVLLEDAKMLGLDIRFPTRDLATDNSIMIALAGYFTMLKKKPSQNKKLRPNGNLEL